MNKRNWVKLKGIARKRYKGFHPKIWFSGNEGDWKLYIFNKETKRIMAQTPRQDTQDKAMEVMLDHFDKHNINVYRGKS